MQIMRLIENSRNSRKSLTLDWVSMKSTPLHTG
ncbi:Protein of unknown function [Bacillus mycoides]|nr:Protein of unknown function [Bacillus mycoides]